MLAKFKMFLLFLRLFKGIRNRIFFKGFFFKRIFFAKKSYNRIFRPKIRNRIFFCDLRDLRICGPTRKNRIFFHDLSNLAPSRPTRLIPGTLGNLGVVTRDSSATVESTKKKKKVAKRHRLTRFEPRSADFRVKNFADFFVKI